MKVLNVIPAAVAACVVALSAQEHADLVLYNGQVLTANSEDPSAFEIATAVAVRADSIVAVGADADVRRLAGPGTRAIDLKGKGVLPGLIDTHAHVDEYALGHHGAELQNLPPWFWDKEITFDTKQNGLAEIKNLAVQKKPGEWLKLSGEGQHLPIVWHDVTLADLDGVAPSNPVYIQITNVQNHAKVNSAALDLLDRKYPKGLRGIDKDAKGRPTGLIRGEAAAVMYEQLIPKPPVSMLAPIYLKEAEEFVAMGITALSSRLPSQSVATYEALQRDGTLPFRVAVATQAPNDTPDPANVVKRLGPPRGDGASDMIWLNSVTPINIDGTPGMAWACISAPYPREHKDFPLWRHQLFGPHGECTLTHPGYRDRDIVVAAVRNGQRVTGMHVGGDKALDTFLDLLEEVDPNATIRDRRFGVDHCRFIDDTHVARAKKYGIIFSCAPKYVYSGSRGDIGAYGVIFGERVAEDVVVPMRRLVDSGLKPVMEIDTHGMYSFLNLETMVTRKDRNGRVWGERQRIDRREALYTFTRWAARYILREQDLGSIEPGKKADLVIVDRDYLAIPADEISEIGVLMTVVDGQIRYTEPTFADAAGLPQVGFRGAPPWREPGRRGSAAR